MGANALNRTRNRSLAYVQIVKFNYIVLGRFDAHSVRWLPLNSNHAAHKQKDSKVADNDACRKFTLDIVRRDTA